MIEDSTKKDCIFYRPPGGKMGSETCSALTKVYCKKERCKFYKTAEQEQKDRKKYGEVEREWRKAHGLM